MQARMIGRQALAGTTLAHAAMTVIATAGARAPGHPPPASHGTDMAVVAVAVVAARGVATALTVASAVLPEITAQCAGRGAQASADRCRMHGCAHAIHPYTHTHA